MEKLSTSIIDALKSVVGDNPASLHAPEFAGNEWKYLKNCLDTTVVSSVGTYVTDFEDYLAQYTGTKYAIAVVNGTAALHISLKLVGVKAGDEVLIPALTFIATANAVNYVGATPHLVDSEELTLGIDPSKLDAYLRENTINVDGWCVNKSTHRVIRAIIPMHTFGHPVRMDELMEVCSKFNIVVVEDAAESLGSFYKGQHTGTMGRIGVLSFNGNKIITTGGGGAILTDDSEIARLAKHLTTTAKISHSWEFNHDQVGYNYRMPNINAALGCAQLEQIDYKLKQKRYLQEKYSSAFTAIKGASIFKEANFAKSNYWLNVLLLSEGNHALLSEILNETNASGIMTRPVWGLISNQLPYKNVPSMNLDIASKLSTQIVNIPSSPGLL